MSEPTDKWVCEKQAQALEALASLLWFDGLHVEATERIYAAAKVLREPLAADQEQGK